MMLSERSFNLATPPLDLTVGPRPTWSGRQELEVPCRGSRLLPIECVDHCVALSVRYQILSLHWSLAHWTLVFEIQSLPHALAAERVRARHGGCRVAHDIHTHWASKVLEQRRHLELKPWQDRRATRPISLRHLDPSRLVDPSTRRGVLTWTCDESIPHCSLLTTRPAAGPRCVSVRLS